MSRIALGETMGAFSAAPRFPRVDVDLFLSDAVTE